MPSVYSNKVLPVEQGVKKHWSQRPSGARIIGLLRDNYKLKGDITPDIS